MELYLDVRSVGRGSKGRTACGSSAYRACENITDNGGVVHRYHKKSGHVAGGIELPDGAPEELRDRQTLWQRHDSKETRKDAQIFREVIVALPNELSDDACCRVLRKIMEPLIEMGMCAQWDLHNAHPKNEKETDNQHPENKHAHIMLTMRELLPDGTFGKKNRSWNKYNGGINLADILRPEAARFMNEELQKIHSDNVVEHKSYAERGINKLPQIKIGVAGYHMTDRGKISYRKAMCDAVKRINEENISYQERLLKVHEARQTLSNIGIKDVPKPSLFAQIEATEMMKDSDTSTAKERIRDHYNNVKQYNQQIYDLRKEKRENEKYRRALYTLRNLTDVAELDDEQRQQLSWAQGYLKWATGTDALPAGAELEQLINDAKERNTERCLGIFKAEKSKRETLQAIAQEKNEEYNRHRRIAREYER